MTYFGRIQHSWYFLLDCFKFLKNNPDLLILPFLSLLAMGGLVGSLLYFSFNDINQFIRLYQQDKVLLISGALGFYFFLSFIILYFNAALMNCVLQRLQGNQFSVRQGLVLTISKAGPLFQWTLVSASICLLINLLEKLNSAIADLMSAVFGFSWGITSYFVLPVMIAENIGPIQAFKKSINLIGRGWRRLVSINVIFYLILLALVGIGYGLVYFTPQLIEALPINLPVLAFLLFAWVVMCKTFNAIFNCALYLNIKGKPLQGFNEQAIRDLMAQNKK